MNGLVSKLEICCIKGAVEEEVIVEASNPFEPPPFTSQQTAAGWNSGDWQERRRFVQSLSHTAALNGNIVAVVPRLEEALRDEHWQVRRQAAITLRRLGEEAVQYAMPALWDACSDRDNLVSAAAIQALQVFNLPIPQPVDGLSSGNSSPSALVPGYGVTSTKTSPKRPPAVVASPKAHVQAMDEETSEGGLSTTDDDHPVQEFTVTLGSGKDDRGRLGIDIDFGHPAYLKIKKVSTGLVSVWNAENPSQKIEVGDYMVDINGESGCSRRLMELITTESKLVITIRRPDALAYEI